MKEGMGSFENIKNNGYDEKIVDLDQVEVEDYENNLGAQHRDADEIYKKKVLKEKEEAKKKKILEDIAKHREENREINEIHIKEHGWPIDPEF